MLSAAQERTKINPFCCIVLASRKIKEGKVGWWEEVEGDFNLSSLRDASVMLAPLGWLTGSLKRAVFQVQKQLTPFVKGDK